MVEDAAELPAGIGDYVERLVGPYFEAIAAWYEALHVGQTGGVLAEIVERHLGDPFFGIFLNPGHQIHLDEWVNSPIFPGSAHRARARAWPSRSTSSRPPAPTTSRPTSRTASPSPTPTLRDALAAAYPDAWARIEARRAFMREALGIDLHPDVLPFSNIPAYLPPFLLRPERAMTMAG